MQIQIQLRKREEKGEMELVENNGGCGTCGEGGTTIITGCESAMLLVEFTFICINRITSSDLKFF